MFISWEQMLDFITYNVEKKNFMKTFEKTTNNDKVALCMKNNFIRTSLEQWLNNIKFNESLKSPNKSKEIRLKANDEYKKNQLKLCYKLYTNAAQLAPLKSLELALAFSNRSAVYIKLKQYQNCIRDIDDSLDILENSSIDENEINKGQLIVRLLKRKIECLIFLKQNNKAQICWEKVLELSNNVYKISLEEEFVQKCKILTYHKKHVSVETETSKNIDDIIQPYILTEDLIKNRLEKNKITLPFKSSKLKLNYTEDKGKHFVASTNIYYGELLIFENPFAFVLLSDYYDSFCYNCCIALEDYSIPCNNCCTVLFCNKSCRQESWDLYHRWECKQGTSIFKCIGIAHLALRLVLTTLKPNSNNIQVFNLLTHIDDLKPKELLQYSLTATLLLLYLQKKTNFFEEHPELVWNSVGSDLLYSMTKLVCNGNAISTHMISDYDSGSLTTFIDESQPRIGTAIFPTSSLLNHSCDPNVFSSNILKYVVIKASRDINKGEEVTNCYGPNFRRMRFSERQASLKAQYHFDCKCCVCIDPSNNDIIDKLDRLKCLKCNKVIKATLQVLDITDTICCDLCLNSIKTEEYKMHLIEADTTYNKGMEELDEGNVKNSIITIFESVRLYSKILNDKNPNITKCEDSLAKCFIVNGDIMHCYSYLKKNLLAIEERFGKNSLEVAYELDKISDITVNYLNTTKHCNLTQETLECVHRSMDIFHANLSAWDIPYNESVIANIKTKEIILLQILGDGNDTIKT